jgi:hypothetical protein
MSTDRDVTRIVRSWLRSDEADSADRVLDAVLDALDTTPQRRATRWSAWTGSFMSGEPIGFVIGAAAVLVLVIVGLQLLPGGNLGGPIATDVPSPQPTATATQDAWAPGAALDRGRNDLMVDDVRFSIEVPEGWRTTQYEGMISFSPPSGGHYPWVGLLWKFDRVADDPCTASARPVGPSVDDLANGLTTIPETDATEPSDTTIGGIPARYVELTVHDEIGCEPNEFWLYGPDSAWPNSVDSTIRVWIFELDGTRYVIHSDQVGGNPDVGNMMVDVVESIEFEQP